MSEQHNPFSEEALAKLRARIGELLPPSHYPPHNKFACEDAIRHFAYGYGDTNPLWTDAEYAKRTKYRSIVAPPTFLYSCRSFPVASTGLRGAHALDQGEEWHWFQPVLVGDTIRDEEKLIRFEEIHGKFASPMFEQVAESTFYNQREEVVAKEYRTVWRFARYSSEKRDKYKDITRKTYTPEEIEAIKADYKKEEIRGSKPRYWDDVKIGEAMRHVVKGPLTVTDVIAWKIGWGFYPFVRAFGIRFDYEERHPTIAVLNSWGIPDVPERVHWDDELAQTIGIPFAFDYGPQRATYFAQVATNWMGNDGFLKTLKVRIKLPCYIGDTTWCRGKVVGKRVEKGEHLVDCELWCDDHQGRRTALAWATIALPERTQTGL